MNNLDLTNFEELQTSIQNLHPYNLIINFLNTFSFPKFYIPSLYFLFISFFLTFLLMHNKYLKKIYDCLEFLMVVEYLTIIYVIF